MPQEATGVCLHVSNKRSGPHMGTGATQVEASMLPGINGGYVTYRVDTSSTLPGYAQPDMSVRRRFREFVVRCAAFEQLCVMTFCSKLGARYGMLWALSRSRGHHWTGWVLRCFSCVADESASGRCPPAVHDAEGWSGRCFHLAGFERRLGT